jgi:hypothetical protein
MKEKGFSINKYSGFFKKLPVEGFPWTAAVRYVTEIQARGCKAIYG